MVRECGYPAGRSLSDGFAFFGGVPHGRRYDAGKRLLLSTNKSFAEWNEVFPHAACVVTVVDRLIHRAEVMDIEAESYRLKEAKERAAARNKQLQEAAN
jgi:hypothetical protein